MGTETLYRSVNKAVCAMRMADFGCSEVVMDESNWAEDINQDYQKRSGKKKFRW